ncbi:MAG: sterol desaturase family protein [Bacteroidetes bacterium]|nr:sterol desaturase family protein [Bacteroidota bacterium]
MDAYANALLYAIPGFMVLMLIEIAYGHYVKNQKYRLFDTLSSLSSGVTNVLKDSLGLALVLVSYPFLASRLAVVEVSNSWLTWVIAFVVIDFAGYWNHRLSHRVNIFWNQHVIHHSSEDFNLACALRQSISNVVGYTAILLLPAALLGVEYSVIAVLAPLHLFGQFWYHTQHIGKLGFLEYILVTPSQHRVHHAINEQYIDKNLGQIFSVWDRLFGTFQEELDEVPPRYGVLKPAMTYNPLWINFQHAYNLAFDAWHAKRFTDKLRIWFMPTGWRPADVAQRFERPIIEDVYAYEKYDPKSTLLRRVVVFAQFVLAISLLFYFFALFSELSNTYRLYAGALIFLMVMGYSSLMDGSRWALAFEALRIAFVIGLYLWSPAFFDALGLPFTLLVGLSALSGLATKWALSDA